jgi:AcrR family transcriptional regulator
MIASTHRRQPPAPQAGVGWSTPPNLNNAHGSTHPPQYCPSQPVRRVSRMAIASSPQPFTQARSRRPRCRARVQRQGLPQRVAGRHRRCTEQLLFECFQAGLERIRAGLREVEHSPRPGRERLDEVVRHYAEAVASEFGWCMVRAEDQDLGPELSLHIKKLKAEIDRGIRRLLDEGIRDGSIEPCDTKMTAFAMAGALNWIAHWYRENQPMTPAQVADKFVAVFEAGLLPRGTPA